MPTKHNSQDYNFVPGNALALNWSNLVKMFNDDEGTNPCYLVLLDMRQISFILSHVDRFPLYHWIWGLPSPRAKWDDQKKEEWSEISDFVATTRECLTMGCELEELLSRLDNLTATQRMMVAAIIGERVDLASDMPVEVDYTESGLVPALLATSDSEDLDAKIENIEKILDAIQIILGGAAILAGG